jgi:hypothetical protein
MQRLEIYQSLWAMELRRPDGYEWPLERKFEMCAEAGYDGLAIDLVQTDIQETLSWRRHYEKYRLGCLINAFVNVVGLVMPLRVEEAAEVVRAWLKMATEEKVEIHFETHRNCITNDLFFTLLLMEAVPEMRLCGDLSHYMIDREFRYPLSDGDQKLIERILERCDAYQGRVSSREQIQIPLHFPQSRKWLDLYLDWWERGFRLWRNCNGEDAVLNFQCELGPPEYAITDANGAELSDRWQEALQMRSLVQDIWRRLEAEHP